ncbi:MAG: SDR family oxidoreductase [Chloroflexota bacterium]
MARILVTGASGLLGANFVLTATEEHEVVAVCHRERIERPDLDVIQADLSHPGVAREVVASRRVQWVIHCAAATDVDACELDPAGAFRLNRDMARQVAEAARAEGAGLVHISTDAVFDGEAGPYREEDEARPVNVYGRSKLEGERAVLAAHPEALVVRTNIYGWNALPKRSLAEWFLERLEQGQRTPGFTDVWVTPILVSDLARLILSMIVGGLRGLYHVAGAECVSKYDFGRAVAQVFGLEPGLIYPARVGEAGLRAPRALRLCLNGSKVERDLDVRLPGVVQGLKLMRGERDQGRLAELKKMALTTVASGKGADR